jgi:hypothetical protein
LKVIENDDLWIRINKLIRKSKPALSNTLDEKEYTKIKTDIENFLKI